MTTNNQKATMVRYGPWQIAIAVKHALCSDGKRRYARITGEPDTMWTIPASVHVHGKTVSGFVSSFINEDGKEDIGFTAYTYGKNGSELPGSSHVR